MPPFECNHDGSCTKVRLCCTNTEMTLTKKDMERIDALGYSQNDYLIRMGDGFYQLRNVDGNCYFYNTTSKECRIYQNRPEGCRYYPIVYNVEKRVCVADYDCPSGITITKKDIRKICSKVQKLVECLIEESQYHD